MSRETVLEGLRSLERQIVDETSFRETGRPDGLKEIVAAHRRRAKGEVRVSDVLLSSAALAPLAIDEIVERNRASRSDAERSLVLAALCLTAARHMWTADAPETLILQLTTTGLAFVDRHRREKRSRTMSAVGASPGESEQGKPSRKDAAAVPPEVKAYVLEARRKHPDWSVRRIAKRVQAMLGQSETTARRKVRKVLG